jgi:hypothetical protein
MNDEQFLTRWSRRKQEARAGHAEPAPEEAPEANGAASSERAAAESEAVLAEAELSNLPPIESIDAATDITAFLRKGIPQELSRAALRRAWSADPAIRDFVGLAENAWDFNDPNAMHGFGPLDYSTEQVDALVRRILGGIVETAESLLDQVADPSEDAPQSPLVETCLAQSSNPVKEIAEPRPLDRSVAAELPAYSAASQLTASDEHTPLRRRTHGGALPQ